MAAPLTALSGKRVLVTGHTGFKGSWLSIWLQKLGAEVTGYSLAPETTPNNFDICDVKDIISTHHIGDICDKDAMIKCVKEARPDVIFHMAAQAIVHEGYSNPVGTFNTNMMGTAHVLEAVRILEQPCIIVVVSSDKCYENREHVWGYRECDAMGGYDPYSASKGGTEIVTSSYRQSFFNPENYDKHGVALASARAGNVLGGGDWAQARIIPDIVKSLNSNKPVELRNPGAVRPWQHVLEPLSGYLSLAAHMIENTPEPYCGGWNFGPDNESTVNVQTITELAINVWGSGSWVGGESLHNPHEANILRLAIDKAYAQLDWQPRFNLNECISRTIEWYRRYYQDKDANMLTQCQADIAAYEDTI